MKRIRGWAIRRTEYHDKAREELYLLLKGGKIARLHAQDIGGLKTAIENEMKALNLPFEEDTTLLSSEDERVARFLRDGERIIYSGRMWYFAPAAITSAKTATWKPGQLYLTGERLCFWDNLMKKIVFQIPRDKISRISLEKRDFTQKTGVEDAKTVSSVGRGDTHSATKAKGTSSNTKKALTISSTNGTKFYFSGKTSEMQKWQKILEEEL